MRKRIWHRLLDALRILQIIDNQKEMIGLQRESLFANIFNSTIVDSEWLKYRSFSPGGWAVEYGFLYVLYRVLEQMHPYRILEFGLGQSSKMLHQYATYYKKHAVTVEHDTSWIDFFKVNKAGDYDVNIQQLGIEMTTYKGVETRTYAGIADFCTGKYFDLVVVDSPFGSEHYSRSQIIDIAKNNLSKSFCVIIDDTERRGEKESIKEICNMLQNMGVDYCLRGYWSRKQFTLICSQDLHFLTSLC